MSNVPLILVGGAVAIAVAYFVTKSKAPTTIARENLQRSMVGGTMRMKPITSDDPPLQGAMVAEVCNVKRASTWSKQNPQFVLDCDSGIVPGFSHQYAFTDKRKGSPYNGQLLYRPGPNPNAPYPSDFVETSQGVASLLDVLGKAATSAVTINKQGRQRPQATMPMMMPPVQQSSNTGLILAILLGGAAIIGAFLYFNKPQGA